MARLNVFIDGTWLLVQCAAGGSMANSTEHPDRLWRDLDTAAFTGELLKKPAVSTAFLGLLGASHAGYLAYKATPKT